jgi:NADH-quinone oxidoreductase subunit N
MDMRRHGDEGRNATCTKLVDRLPVGRSAVPVLVAVAVAALGAAAPLWLIYHVSSLL